MGASNYDRDPDEVVIPGTSHALMLELIGSNMQVLDVGCDTGYLGRELLTRGCAVSGVEMNPKTAEVAAQYLERVLVGDLETADLVAEFGRESFDVVVFGDVLEHLRDPLSVLRQARPLLRPGGRVVISTPNIAHGDVRLALLSGRFNYSRIGILDDTHLRFFTRDTLVAFLHDAGLVLAELRRSVAPLFSTELDVRPEDYPDDVVAPLREDVEATTYQFVVSAISEDAASVQSEQALRVDALIAERDRLVAGLETLRRELEALREELSQTTAHRNELAERLTAAGVRLDQVQAAHDLAVGQRDALLAGTLGSRRSIPGLMRRAARKVRDLL